MTRAEYVVVVLGLLLGYWIVNRFFSGKSSPEAESSEKQEFEREPKNAATSSASGSWEVVLGVQRTAKVEEIRRAYKFQMSQYHPDKVAALGSELRSLAERKSKDINAAYKQAMRARGVSEQLW